MREVQLPQTQYVAVEYDDKEEMKGVLFEMLPCSTANHLICSIDTGGGYLHKIVRIIVFRQKDNDERRLRKITFLVDVVGFKSLQYYEYCHDLKPSEEVMTEYYNIVRDSEVIERSLDVIKPGSEWYHTSSNIIYKMKVVKVGIYFDESSPSAKLCVYATNGQSNYQARIYVRPCDFIKSDDGAGGKFINSYNSSYKYYESFDRLKEFAMSRLRTTYNSIHGDMVRVRKLMASLNSQRKEDL